MRRLLAVSHCEWCGAFSRREVSSSVRCDTCEDAEANNERLLAKRRLGKGDDTILEKSMQVVTSGFASEPMALEELQKVTGEASFHLI